MSRMQCSQVLMWGRKGRQRDGCWMYSVMDCISKEEPSPSAHPSSSKPLTSPFTLCVSLASALNLYSKEKDATNPKMLSFSRRFALDKYSMCHGYGHCGQQLPAFTIVCSSVCVCVCVCVGCRSSQVIFLVLPVHAVSNCYCVYTLQYMEAVGAGEETDM